MPGPATPVAEHLPKLRLVPAPHPSLPYDDEPPHRVAAWRPDDATDGGTQGTLALAFALPSGLPVTPAPSARLRVVGRNVGDGPPRQPRDRLLGHTLGQRPGSASSAADEATACRPEPNRWAALIAQAIVEAEVGDRPLSQLVRWTTAEVYDVIAVRCSTHGRRSAVARLGTARAVVASIHVCQIAPDIAEVCATVRRAGRARAVALRLEGIGDAWRCTALTMG